MKVKWLLLLLAAAVVAGFGAYAVYPRPKAQYPRYCRLVFGPEAETKRLVRFDGKALSIERDGDGRFDSEEERFSSVEECKNVVIPDGDGRTSYVITKVNESGLTKPPWTVLIFHVDIKGPLEYRQIGDVDTATKPEDAPLVHFHGPLTAHVAPLRGRSWQPPEEPLKLRKGEKPTELYVVVATLKDNGDAGVRSEAGGKRILPEIVRPVVDIEFPPKQRGNPPIRKTYTLDKVC